MLLHENPVSGSDHEVIVSIRTGLKFKDQTGRSREHEDAFFHDIAFLGVLHSDAVLSLQMDTMYLALPCLYS